MRDVRMDNVGLELDRAYGISLDINMVADLERVEMRRVRGMALHVSGPLSATDLRIDSMLPARNSFGIAMWLSRSDRVDDTGTVQVERAVFDGLFDIGVNISRREVAMSHVQVMNTLSKPCTDEPCASDPGGSALGVYFDARLDAHHVRVSGAELCGLHFALGGDVHLSDSTITGAAIGACVQVDGFPLENITEGVRYEDNGTNIETTDLALPEPVPPPSFG